MKAKQVISLLAIVASAFLLSACGEGGVIGTGATVSVGVIQARSDTEITVNDVRYQTTQASISRNKTAVDASALNVGMVATVNGTVNPDGTTGTAEDIQVKDLVAGPISAIEDSQTIIVMGQRIYVDDATIYFQSDKGQLILKDNIIVINGFLGEDGKIYATYIEHDDDGSFENRISGYITSIDAASEMLFVGQQQVSYQNAEIEHGTKQDLAAGLLVEVEGHLDTTLNILVAEEIEIAHGHIETDERHSIELEGFVTGIETDVITVNGVRVTINDNTQYEHGQAADLMPGKKVQVYALSNTQGQLIATRIEFKDSDGESSDDSSSDDSSSDDETSSGDDSSGTLEQARVRANITDISGDATQLTLSGGLIVDLTDTTDFNGVSNALALDAGDHIEVRLVQSGSIYLVERLDFKNSSPEEDVIVEGEITALNNPYVSVAGYQIDMNSLSVSGDFFAEAQLGDTLYVQGKASGNDVDWQEAELK